MYTLDKALHSESPPQKRSGMARVLTDFAFLPAYTHRSIRNQNEHTCLCLPSYSWFSFADPGGMEG